MIGMDGIINGQGTSDMTPISIFLKFENGKISKGSVLIKR